MVRDGPFNFLEVELKLVDGVQKAKCSSPESSTPSLPKSLMVILSCGSPWGRGSFIAFECENKGQKRKNHNPFPLRSTSQSISSVNYFYIMLPTEPNGTRNSHEDSVQRSITHVAVSLVVWPVFWGGGGGGSFRPPNLFMNCFSEFYSFMLQIGPFYFHIALYRWLHWSFSPCIWLDTNPCVKSRL